ncbi:MAG: PepSY domain-containing protein [Acidobacteriota bacterium]|nr:MAG: PepSY domain-containing protein [Acidobacteriota bacterium]
MRSLILKAHIWLGIIVSIPVLAWAVSGFLYAIPNTVEGGKVEVIDRSRVRIAASEAMEKANSFAGRELPTTALTLLMRDGAPHYQAIGGMGADSILINAETGEVLNTPPPNAATRFFRQAHFYYFAGSWQVTLLLVFSALASLSAATGIYLNCVYWLAPKKRAVDSRTLREGG